MSEEINIEKGVVKLTRAAFIVKAEAKFGEENVARVLAREDGGIYPCDGNCGNPNCEGWLINLSVVGPLR